MTVSFAALGQDLNARLSRETDAAIPVYTAGAAKLKHALPEAINEAGQAWLRDTGWRAKPGAFALLPSRGGGLGAVLLATGDDESPFAASLHAGALAAAVPEGTYRFADFKGDPASLVLAWLMSSYSFRHYLSGDPAKIRKLALPEGVDFKAAVEEARAIWFARELINLPANDLGPNDLAAALASVAAEYGAEVETVTGEDLLTQNFPLIHAVGRASDRPPCLAGLRWGNPAHPKVTIAGKGICFDTGGLDIKPAQAMMLMKKDMGGAASAIALGAMIMAAKLPVRLRILIPAADNNISANAFRPGDILASRAGLSIEVGNTDAEGRLVLADALAFADEEAPELLIDLATLTGAARVALGPDLPPFYTDDDGLAQELLAAGDAVADPVWRMPLWGPYNTYLKSKAADLNNAYNGPYAGSITAALFLKRFVKQAQSYVHLDIYGWTPKTMPGKPAGGEPQGARALFEVILGRYGQPKR